MTHQLKPCPFCGETPQGFDTNQGTKWGFVSGCCLAGGPEVRTSYHKDSWHPDAVREWNMRPVEDRLRGVLEAVLLFHKGGQWHFEDDERWQEITGTAEVTTKNLCDTIRGALDHEPI